MDVLDMAQYTSTWLKMTCSCHFAEEAPAQLSLCVPEPSVALHQGECLILGVYSSLDQS